MYAYDLYEDSGIPVLLKGINTTLNIEHLHIDAYARLHLPEAPDHQSSL